MIRVFDFFVNTFEANMQAMPAFETDLALVFQGR